MPSWSGESGRAGAGGRDGAANAGCSPSRSPITAACEVPSPPHTSCNPATSGRSDRSVATIPSWRRRQSPQKRQHRFQVTTRRVPA